MKLFIGVESCHAHRFTHQQIRETWLSACPIDYKFFLVSPCSDAQSDEVILDSFDGQWKLLHKFRREVDYVLIRGYDYFFRCHVDTYVHVPRLMRAVPVGLDYVGFPQDNREEGREICYGGPGFWLSRTALLYLQRRLAEPDWVKEAEHCIEDWHIGAILKEGGFKRTADLRYHDRLPGPAPDNDCISHHESAQEVWLTNPHNLREKKYLLEAHAIALQIGDI
jgi:hypothetical protein